MGRGSTEFAAVSKLIAKVDKDGDGQLDIKEFIALFKVRNSTKECHICINAIKLLNYHLQTIIDTEEKNTF